ncbi:hypothetical protein HYT92_00810 [Candidatus Pacearchaeota archaeon]|nr:hypothetical protein [Candidatus Pacearchaeota archaeon]
MTIDFFVHPEYPNPIYRNGVSREAYAKYLDDLMEVARASAFPVLIRGHHDHHFMDLIPKERHFMSYSLFVKAPPVYKIQETGLVLPDQWDRFAQMLASADYQDNGPDTRVHGAFFGKCPKDFAVQLFLYLASGQYFSPYAEDEQPLRQSAIAHMLQGNFKRSKIKYGNVFDDPNKPSVIVPPPENLLIWLIEKLTFSSSFPNGDINYQLIDSRTAIYRPN